MRVLEFGCWNISEWAAMASVHALSLVIVINSALLPRYKTESV
jgi:hypothetical protein